MSHIVKIKVNKVQVNKVQTELTNREAIEAVCRKLGLRCQFDQHFNFQHDGSAYGTVVNLPNCDHPIVITHNGEIRYEQYDGRRGNVEKELSEFRRIYTEELNKLQQARTQARIEETLVLNGMVIETSHTNSKGELVLQVVRI